MLQTRNFWVKYSEVFLTIAPEGRVSRDPFDQIFPAKVAVARKRPQVHIKVGYHQLGARVYPEKYFISIGDKLIPPFIPAIFAFF